MVIFIPNYLFIFVYMSIKRNKQNLRYFLAKIIVHITFISFFIKNFFHFLKINEYFSTRPNITCKSKGEASISP